MHASPLDPFWKLDRATRHLKELEANLLAFLQPDCYEIVNESRPKGQVVEGKPGRTILTRRVIFKDTPPLLHWGTVVGDVVHNLRSALDHVVYTISYRRNPSEFRDDRTTAFPICNDLATFHRRRRREWEPYHEIRGIPDEAKAIIEGLQPYQRGQDDLRSDPLWILREMDDIDKHRTIHITGWSAHSIVLDITDVQPGVRVHSLSVRPVGAIESGAILVEIDFTSAKSDAPTMYLHKEFLFEIAFDKDTPLPGLPVQGALYDLAFYVEGILNSLHRFVPSTNMA